MTMKQARKKYKGMEAKDKARWSFRRWAREVLPNNMMGKPSPKLEQILRRSA